MDKNTIWAIVLSALVLIGFAFFQTWYVVPRQQAAQEQQRIEQQALEAERQAQAEAASKQISAGAAAEADGAEEKAVTVASAEELTVTTDKVKVVFSQCGGDVISYQLLEHLDKDTGAGVEMADNVTDANRAFALAFGDASATAVSELFNVQRDDAYTIGFYRTYEIKDGLGNPHKFMLGKRYQFKQGEYVFKLDITVKPLGDYKDLNVNGAAYTIRTSPQIGPHYDPKANRYDLRQYLALNGSKRVHPRFSSKYYTKAYDWAGVAGKYFTMLIKPLQPQTMSETVRCSTASENSYANSQVFLTRNAIDSGYVNDEYYVYVGPRSERELIKYNSMDKNGWGIVNAKFNQALQNTGLTSFIEVFLKWAMEMIYRLVHNWGVSIIILTIILKIILFPLNKNSAMSSLKMQELQPKMQAIQEKYKDNQQKLSEETAKLYKASGYNPASGCLPMILQMIILWSMYNVFNNYFEFRGASFIPGWIDDLSTGDSIWSWEREIPILSSFTQNHLRLLPFIYTLSQLLNGKITQYGGAAGNAQSQMQMKFMMYGMPILFFFLFYNAPSGLLLYWMASNIIQMGQQLVINNITKKKREEMAKKQPQVDKNTLKFKGKKKRTR